MEIFYKWN